MSTINVGTLSNAAGTASVPSDTVISGTAKAWVNFNGTGTVAIRGSFNVSSITDNGTGDYTINFTNAMPDANYSMCNGGGSFNDGVNDNNIFLIGARRGTINPFTTTSARINSAYRAVGSTSQFDDPAIATLAFFR